MKFKHFKSLAIVLLLMAIMLSVAGCTAAGRSKRPAELERQVTADEVPKPALKTLKRRAQKAEITEFAEEIEHGHTFYEGSWKNKRTGKNMDMLVTKAGAVVEIEEELGIKAIPKAVSKAARQAAGKNVKLAFEKKTTILYEVKFTKDGRRHELLLTPDGRTIEEEIETGPGDK